MTPCRSTEYSIVYLLYDRVIMAIFTCQLLASPWLSNRMGPFSVLPRIAVVAASLSDFVGLFISCPGFLWSPHRWVTHHWAFLRPAQDERRWGLRHLVDKIEHGGAWVDVVTVRSQVIVGRLYRSLPFVCT